MSRNNGARKKHGTRTVPPQDQWIHGYQIQLGKAASFAAGSLGVCLLAGALASLAVAAEPVSFWSSALAGLVLLAVGGPAFARLRGIKHSYPYRTGFMDSAWHIRTVQGINLGVPVVYLLIGVWVVLAFSTLVITLLHAGGPGAGWPWPLIGNVLWLFALYVAPALVFHRWPGSSPQAATDYESGR